jgi:para-nitrobenzyl esterase
MVPAGAALAIVVRARGKCMLSKVQGFSAIAGALFALVASGVASAGVMAPVTGDPVRIDSGVVAGTLVDPAVKAYLGIPFAAPPVRENRWRAPQPVKPWTGIYTADEFKPECPQGLRSPSINHYFGEEAVSEDCLYLNIWAPAAAKPGDKLPVVVWIYGGAFNVGSASSPIYSGEPLAHKGVIYVAANYRLGVFGFMAHPELTAESGHGASGNWGFLDQVAALKWVQRNIAAFGGDPANVTLVGQSAGSMSINDLQASPLARGLFERAFGMSGATIGAALPGLDGAPLAAAEATGVKLQQAMKAEHIADLRMVSWDKVMAAAQASRLRFGPDIDGYYLPDSAQHIFEAGRQSDVPVVTGSTANDIGTNVPIRQARTLAEYRALAQQSYGAKAAEFLKLWPAKDDASAAHEADEVGRNSGFTLGARSWAHMQTATGRQPAYLFMVTKVQPFTPGVRFSDFDPATAGAYHMGDVPYFLGTYEAFNLFRKTRDWTAADRALSEKMQDVIVAFARTGNPNTPAVKFVRYDPKDEQRTVFGDTIRTEKLNTRGMDFLLANPPAEPQRQPQARPRQTF